MPRHAVLSTAAELAGCWFYHKKATPPEPSYRQYHHVTPHQPSGQPRFLNSDSQLNLSALSFNLLTKNRVSSSIFGNTLSDKLVKSINAHLMY